MIIWGTKHVESGMGRTADFCILCRRIRPHRITALKSVGHVYYISLGRGRVFDHTKTCEKCDHTSSVDPTIYSGLAKLRSKDDVRALVQSCFPKIGEVYGNRLELEERLVKSPDSVDPELREELIREVLVEVAPVVEKRYEQTNLDWRAGLSALVTIVATALVAMLGSRLLSDPVYSESILKASVATFCLGFLVTFGFATQVNRRYVRRVIVPKVAHAMRPLRPNEAELDAMLARFKASGLKVGKKLKAADVCRAIDPALARSIA